MRLPEPNKKVKVAEDTMGTGVTHERPRKKESKAHDAQDNTTVCCVDNGHSFSV